MIVWRIAVPLVVGFLVALVAGALILPLLRRSQIRQHAYEDAPPTHQTKTGTPTMGGIVFLIALLPILIDVRSPFVTSLYLLVLVCGFVGLIDDGLSITHGRNRGLKARTKFLATALIAIVFLRVIYNSYAPLPRDVIFHAGAYVLSVPHWLWLLLGIVAITGTIHAVNLTDGLDGLAAGTTIPPAIVLAVLGFQFVIPAAAEASLLVVGACFAFLMYNRHPATMFMGDTGSLALGAALSGVAILTGEMLLLVLIGGVFVVEALSVIAQVAYFKRTGGKRILRMSPLHHHFELGGWPETTVTRRFWFASAALSAIGLAIVR
ncbi:MAG: phospho-N-acetylmuramoyl-pentapeptide-transferase [Candidatus Eremiobacteraeota bacterium]|nr:phospho-N-acetylmuramoyl-pentapeptide-transferase [Candidatus Eremiobacteraeota bacterium]